MSEHVTWSYDEKMLVLHALNVHAEKLEGFAKDCEKLTESERKLPTDHPEKWRKELSENRALFERLSRIPVILAAPSAGGGVKP